MYGYFSNNFDSYLLKSTYFKISLLLRDVNFGVRTKVI